MQTMAVARHRCLGWVFIIDRGMSKEDALRRIAVQMTNDEYAALGDHVIDNSGTVDELNGKIEDLIKSELNERGIRV